MSAKKKLGHPSLIKDQPQNEPQNEVNNPVSNTLENKADLVKLFEILIKVDRRVNLTGSYETQNNRNTNNSN